MRITKLANRQLYSSPDAKLGEQVYKSFHEMNFILVGYKECQVICKKIMIKITTRHCSYDPFRRGFDLCHCRQHVVVNDMFNTNPSSLLKFQTALHV